LHGPGPYPSREGANPGAHALNKPTKLKALLVGLRKWKSALGGPTLHIALSVCCDMLLKKSALSNWEQGFQMGGSTFAALSCIAAANKPATPKRKPLSAAENVEEGVFDYDDISYASLASTVLGWQGVLDNG